MKECAVDIVTLLFHLRNCPSDFLRPSALLPGGSLHTNALLRDVYRLVNGDPVAGDGLLPQRQASTLQNANHLAAIHIGCWLFAHPVFAGDVSVPEGMDELLFPALEELSVHVPADEWVRDENRSEELVRLALHCCGLLPKGESEAEAADRFEAVGTLKRLAIRKESEAALERIREVRRKMAEEKAREAANVYGRE